MFPGVCWTSLHLPPSVAAPCPGGGKGRRERGGECCRPRGGRGGTWGEGYGEAGQGVREEGCDGGEKSSQVFYWQSWCYYNCPGRWSSAPTPPTGVATLPMSQVIAGRCRMWRTIHVMYFILGQVIVGGARFCMKELSICLWNIAFTEVIRVDKCQKSRSMHYAVCNVHVSSRTVIRSQPPPHGFPTLLHHNDCKLVF